MGPKQAVCWLSMHVAENLIWRDPLDYPLPKSQARKRGLCFIRLWRLCPPLLRKKEHCVYRRGATHNREKNRDHTCIQGEKKGNPIPGVQLWKEKHTAGRVGLFQIGMPFFFWGVLTLFVHCALRCDVILPLFSQFDLSGPLLFGQVPLLKLKLPRVHGEPAVISNGGRSFKCTFSANSYFGYPKQRAPGSPISKSRQIELCLTMKCLKIVTF